MVRVGRPKRVLTALAIAGVLCSAALVTSCRTTEDDVHRWASTLNGPRKLVAVLVHDKYPFELRVEAALTLISMRPRSGQHVGLHGGDDADQPGLLGALTALRPALRAQLVAGLIPHLEDGMAQPPAQAADPSVPYKDAAFGLLTHEDGTLIADPAIREKLQTSLEAWALAAFDARLDNTSQAYGMEQVLRYLGARGVRGLPPQMVVDAPKLARIAALVADLGDESTKHRAGVALVNVARFVGSNAWLKRKEPAVMKANEESNLHPEQRVFRAQLQQYQDEELLRIFGSMKKLGTRPVVEYLIGTAGDSTLPEKTRAAALAALQGRLDKSRPEQIQSMLALARDEQTPDAVRGLALERVGEVPRALVVKDLFALFHSTNWKVRWVAAELVLKMSTSAQLDEFMSELGKIKDMAITEPIRYGALMGNMKPPPSPAELAEKYAAADYATPIRLAALGYFHEYGKNANVSRIQIYANDGNKVPDCRQSDNGCEWRCVVGPAGSQRLEEIRTIGDFVTFCVVPAIQKRNTKNDKPATDAQSPAQDKP